LPFSGKIFFGKSVNNLILPFVLEFGISRQAGVLFGSGSSGLWDRPEETGRDVHNPATFFAPAIKVAHQLSPFVPQTLWGIPKLDQDS
jgi:hypothetical protein